ncbi:spermidine synthase [Legionella spiritensis]|uniref:spermidine synthase n=1 Tax=Legionella spiritensis TaxID=452 RepID=UPI000F6D83A2|nr:fused MFS/spermidine synthase [Legionella spiritensis]VEG92445.1 spermidine synthase [Legionella spiritensis]
MVIRVLFSFSLFLSALLLFVIQPMVAKSLLPVYGGTPAVWAVCMLFFQCLLLISYGYAWVLSRCHRRNVWRVIHGMAVLLALAGLPLMFQASLVNQSPEVVILSDLLKQLGCPLLVIAASAPLLQFAYSRTSARHAHDPYFLYAASNVGSLLALLSYPWLIERYMGLQQQFQIWSYLFMVYAVLLAVIFLLPYQSTQSITRTVEGIDRSRRLLWIAYGFVPCSLMLGVTFYITTDIAAAPLFWVVPLVLYLLSFVLTFARKPLVSHYFLQQNALIFIVIPVFAFILGPNLFSMKQLIAIHLASFMALALLFHGELVRIRPPVEQLTDFYCCLALGGVLAGVFNGLLAPHIFSGAYEYPIGLLLATLCIPLQTGKRPGLFPLLAIGVLITNTMLPEQSWFVWIKANHIAEILALVFIIAGAGTKVNVLVGMSGLFVFLFSSWFKPFPVLDQQRNFYGVKQVAFMSGAYALLSQNILHGFQLPGRVNVQQDGAMAYYGPLQAVTGFMQGSHASMRAMVLGLGTGILACQFRAGDRIDMVDIDEQVIAMANDTRYFTYLRDCLPRITVHKGDGRQVLNSQKDADYDMLVVDAFSSDAIPTHLLTREAFHLYRKRLSSDGVLLVNISNRHLHLLPVLNAAARELDYMLLHKLDPGDNKGGQFPSEWALLTTNQDLAFHLMNRQGWRFVTENSQLLWTDNYSNLIPLLKG